VVAGCAVCEIETDRWSARKNRSASEGEEIMAKGADRQKKEAKKPKSETPKVKKPKVKIPKAKKRLAAEKAAKSG
jgi:hypothetical protein